MDNLKKYLSFTRKHSEMANNLFSLNILSELSFNHFNHLIGTSDYIQASILIELLGYDMDDSKKYKEFKALLKKDREIYSFYVYLKRIGLWFINN